MKHSASTSHSSSNCYFIYLRIRTWYRYLLVYCVCAPKYLFICGPEQIVQCEFSGRNNNSRVSYFPNIRLPRVPMSFTHPRRNHATKSHDIYVVGAHADNYIIRYIGTYAVLKKKIYAINYLYHSYPPEKDLLYMCGGHALPNAVFIQAYNIPCAFCAIIYIFIFILYFLTLKSGFWRFSLIRLFFRLPRRYIPPIRFRISQRD